MNSSSQLFKITFYTLLIQVIIWILSINSSIATDVVIKKFPCENTTTTNCACKLDCLIPYKEENNTYCREKKCWKIYDESCFPNGMNYVAPTVLNAIPFTSVLGVGYGVMERWDLFGIQLAITFGPIVLFCCCVCGNVLYDFRPKDTNVNELEESNYINIEKMSNVYTCCHGVLVITFWIISIVDTATPNKLKDGNGCYLSGFN